jgi:two-component system, NtrC family, sensor kinase
LPHGDTDLGYLAEHLPTAVAEALQGVQRVTTIVRSMQQIVHPGVSDNTPIDVNTTILNAVTLSAHEYNLVADVVTELAALPFVRINGGELTQVLINIVVNAAHAIADVSRRTDKRGMIRVRSSSDTKTVAITIEDTGGGIPDSISRKVFEPFFTTKPVGSGTGQGLSLARGIVERAGGELSFASVVGIGTTFCVRLPIAAAEARRVA